MQLLLSAAWELICEGPQGYPSGKLAHANWQRECTAGAAWVPLDEVADGDLGASTK
jgi:hypothetical protein